jgi:hypothetical protein
VLLTVTIPFIIENSSTFLTTFGELTSRTALFLGVLRWLLKRLTLLNSDTFSIVFGLYQTIVDLNHKEDFNFVACVRLILTYPAHIVEPVFQNLCWNSYDRFPHFTPSLFGRLFRKAPNLAPDIVRQALNKSELVLLWGQSFTNLPYFVPILPILIPTNPDLFATVFSFFSNLLTFPTFPALIGPIVASFSDFLTPPTIVGLAVQSLHWFADSLSTPIASAAFSSFLRDLSAKVPTVALPPLDHETAGIVSSLARAVSSEFVDPFLGLVLAMASASAAFRASLLSALVAFLDAMPAPPKLSAAARLAQLFAALASTPGELEAFVGDRLCRWEFDRAATKDVFVSVRCACLKFECLALALPLLHRAVASGLAVGVTRALLFPLLSEKECFDDVVGLVASVAETIADPEAELSVAMEYLVTIVRKMEEEKREAVREFLREVVAVEDVERVRERFPEECEFVFQVESEREKLHNSPVNSDDEKE